MRFIQQVRLRNTADTNLDTVSGCCGPSRPLAHQGGLFDRGKRSRSGQVPADVAARRGTTALIDRGSFGMGTDDPRGYPTDGEGPMHLVELGAFSLEVHTVTNERFAAFAAATGYRTTAEQYGNSFVFGGLLPDGFPPTRAVAAAPWWREVIGAVGGTRRDREQCG